MTDAQDAAYDAQQALHDQEQGVDPTHDSVDCWCCCWDCPDMDVQTNGPVKPDTDLRP